RGVAIKVLREIYSTDPKFVTRFQRMAKAGKSLSHPNIVQVYDYGHWEDTYFIVTELVEGTDLRRYLRLHGVLEVSQAVSIAHDIALGLGAAHRHNIVHHDPKPQHILLSTTGTVKLISFTGMFESPGTVQYYAPEQALGEESLAAANVYALGTILYEMLVGQPLYDGPSPVAVAIQHIQDPPRPPSELNPNI